MLLCYSCSSSYNTFNSVNSDETFNNIVIHNISFNSSLIVFEGNKIIVQDTIINQGKNSANNFWIKYYLKDKDGQKTYLGERHINTLDSGNTNTNGTELKIPDKIIPKNQTSAKYNIIAYIDASNTSHDANENYNHKQTDKTIEINITRPIYITSDGITNNKTDTQRIDDIVAGLEKKGAIAENYGLGPNTHMMFLKINVPKNALVVDLYGGACAGTIWEMGGNYYNSIKGTRKVYSIWIKTK